MIQQFTQKLHGSSFSIPYVSNRGLTNMFVGLQENNYIKNFTVMSGQINFEIENPDRIQDILDYLRTEDAVDDPECV